MKKIGVLSNPLSRSNSKHLHAITTFLAQHDDVLHVQLLKFTMLRETLQELAARGVELLVINGGDGTVSAVLAEIYEHDVFPNVPIFAILPGGTSNTIAGDVGLRGDRVRSLERLINRVRAGQFEQHVQTRPLIRISYDSNRPALIGMFFGTAAICDAIELRRKIFPQNWIPDPIAGGFTLIYVLLNMIVGRGAKVLSGRPIRIVLDANIEPTRIYSVVMATTLRRIFLGSFPFWGNGDGGVKLTSIRSPARGLVRHAYRLLYGSDKNKLPGCTYTSADADRIELHMQCPFNLDGEFFQPAAGAPVILSGTAPARFVQC